MIVLGKNGIKIEITNIVSSKLSPPMGQARFENTMGNTFFFTYLNTDQSALETKFGFVII